MLVQFVSDHYSNELGNSGEKQVGMKRFLILRFTPGNTKTVFEMVNRFLNIYFFVALSHFHFILGHTNFMVGRPQRKWDLLPSRFNNFSESQ